MLIKIYQKLFYLLPLSPIGLSGHVCRFTPSCSEYTNQAIQKYGIISGLVCGFKRIARCHPFASGGYDPIK